MVKRDYIEEKLLSQYPGVISPITPEDQYLYRAFFAKESPVYGNSWAYITQAANGFSIRGQSMHKLGLKYHTKGESWNYIKQKSKNPKNKIVDYYTQNSLLTIGFFERAGKGHFHIIRPLGENCIKETEKLAKILKNISKTPVFVKKITREQEKALLKNGFSSIEEYSWDPRAQSEDDTWPEHIIDINHLLSYKNGTPNINVKKVRMGFNRFQNIKDRYNTDIKFVPYDLNQADTVRSIIEEQFKYFEESERDICSTKEDYENMILNLPFGKNGKDYFSFVVYDRNKPVAFFLLEKIGKETVGTYANINLLRYPGLSEYLHIKLFDILYKKGIKQVNLGGSELASLDFFKKKFSNKQNKQYWAVYK